MPIAENMTFSQVRSRVSTKKGGLYSQSYENCDTPFRGIIFHEYGITFAFLAVSVELQK